MENFDIKCCKNIRDLGNTESAFGHFKSGILFRGGQLSKAKKKDLLKLEALKIDTYVDLRTDKEISEKPNRMPKNTEFVHIPLFNEVVGGITHEKNADLKLFETIPDMENMYATMVGDKCIANVSKIIKTIIDKVINGKKVYFHCTLGKDRTEIISMILYTILGVDEKHIYKDYLFTNTVMHKTAKRYYWLTRILLFKDKRIAHRLKNLFTARVSFLDAAYNAIKAKWETVEKFISDGLCITNDEIDAFRKVCLD